MDYLLNFIIFIKIQKGKQALKAHMKFHTQAKQKKYYIDKKQIQLKL